MRMQMWHQAIRAFRDRGSGSVETNSDADAHLDERRERGLLLGVGDQLPLLRLERLHVRLLAVRDAMALHRHMRI